MSHVPLSILEPCTAVFSTRLVFAPENRAIPGVFRMADGRVAFVASMDVVCKALGFNQEEPKLGQLVQDPDPCMERRRPRCPRQVPTGPCVQSNCYQPMY